MKTVVALALSTVLVTSNLVSASAWEMPGRNEVGQQVDGIVGQVLQEPEAIGLSIAVGYEDKLILEKGYGTADVEQHVPVNAETMFRIGSLTKQFTAALIMRCAERELLRLDDPISNFCDFPTDEHVVTIRHLLTHISGIKCSTHTEQFRKYAAIERTDQEILDLVRGMPLEFSPGKQFAYSNTGYTLLGVILETVNGETYEELITREILRPLNLTRTRCDSNSEIIENRARGYALEGGKLCNAALLGVKQPGAAGRLLSTAGDLVRWQQALANGRVISVDGYRQMCGRVALADGSESPYGFALVNGESDGLPVVEHGGAINGFSSYLVAYPSRKLTVAALANCEACDAESIAKSIARSLMGIRDTLADLPIPEAEIERVCGIYQPERHPVNVEIHERDRQLYIKINGQPDERLLLQPDGIYRASVHREDRYRFAAGDSAPSLTIVVGGVEVRAVRQP